MKIAIVVSRFNESITTALLSGCQARLQELGVASSDVATTWVPGAVEIPLVAKRYALTNTVDAIIALGAVIRGETSHYDTVCSQVSEGCQRVSLECGIPVIFGVLTTENGAQARDRIGGAHGHKGRDAADVAVEMANIMRSF